VGLLTRVTVGLFAAALIAVSVLDVAFIFWLQRRLVGLPLVSTVDDIMRAEGQAIIALLGTVVLFVVFGLFFLRRAVLRPIEHLITLVGSRDYDALAEFGPTGPDRLTVLGRAVGSMTRRIDNDRAKMRTQLLDIQAAHRELETVHKQVVRSERLAIAGQLAAGFAHEIGNPLAILRGYVDLLSEGPNRDDEESRAIKRMSKELDRIHSTVRELLDFTRAENSAVGPGDAREALEHLRQLLLPQERMREIEFDVHVPEQPCNIALRTDALTQVLVNLTFNAADAVEERGKISISIDVEQASSSTIIRVDDDGPGVAECLRHRIFEPFFTTKGAGKGTGLGLSVSERIIGAAGGELTCEASRLGGASFVIRVPRAAKPPANK